MKLVLECSDSDLSSVNSEIDSKHSIDDVAVIDMSANDDDNDTQVSSVESFVWENVKLQRSEGTI
jgi:hypothetical protein